MHEFSIFGEKNIGQTEKEDKPTKKGKACKNACKLCFQRDKKDREGRRQSAIPSRSFFYLAVASWAGVKWASIWRVAASRSSSSTKL